MNKKSKDWNFALPNGDRFKAMSDILYTYLVSISKHNPKRHFNEDTYKIEDEENYNYIYLDKNPKTGKKDYDAKAIQEKLCMPKTTYYRKYNKLKDLRLIRETYYYDRKILKIPYIKSDRIVDVRTCKFLSEYYGMVGKEVCKVLPEDIIKILAILKIIYYSNDPTFTIRTLKLNLGYSTTNSDKDNYIIYLLDILKSLDLIDYKARVIERDNSFDIIKFDLLLVDDRYNNNLKIHKYIKDGKLKENEIDKEFLVENSQFVQF